MSEAILPLFWDLASPEDEKRIAAVMKLISSLVDSQNENKEELCSDVQYSLKRLVRGLSSPRQAARQGFAEALCELLRQFPKVSTESFVELMKEHLQPSANMKGYEESNVLFGQVVAIVTLIRAKRLSDKTVQQDTLAFIVDQLQTCRGRKSYLKELCASVLGDLVSSMPAKVFKQSLYPLLESDLHCGWSECTAEQFIILLKANQYHSEGLGAKFFETHWGCSSILHEENIPRVVDILLKAGDIHSSKVHCVWIEVATLLMSDVDTFTAFWKAGVETALLNSTVTRRCSAMQLAEAIMPQASVQLLPVILSAPLLKCVVKSISAKKTILPAAAKQFCKGLVETFRKGAEAAPAAGQEAGGGDSGKQHNQLKGLVDVLLDLLWHPSRILRSAVEEVFRGIERHLTPSALELVITSVVGQDDSADKDTDMDVDEEEDSDDDDDEGSGDEDGDGEENLLFDDGSEEDSDVSDVDEEEDMDSDVPSGPATAGTEDSGTDDNDDDDGDDDFELPDEEMPEDPEEIAKVDAALVMALKHRIESKKKRKMERLDLIHFRLRVLDVVEIIIRRSQNASILLRLVMPLFELTLEKASDSQARALIQKAQGLLKSRLCKTRTRSLSSAEDLDEGYAVLRRLIDISRHAHTAATSTLATEAIMYTLRLMHTSSSANDQAAAVSSFAADPAKIVELFAAPVEEFITKKSSRLSSSLFTEILSRYPSVAWLLARTMAKHLPDSANEFRRKEICVLLCTLLSRRDASSHAPVHFSGLAKVLRHSLTKTLTLAAQTSDKAKAKNFRQLILLAQHFLKLSTIHGSEKLASAIRSDLQEPLKMASECNLAQRSPEIKSLIVKQLS
ncbi:uncharacterized protein LOC135817757 [Sycon ciliatum]|uniref:uncharacterized protein LOC135817757 n=1 Tax=Sycon ciliatum TaxID=27933 RepID=UPI0031F6E909